MLHGMSTADRARLATAPVGILAALDQELDAVLGDFEMRSAERILSARLRK